MPPFPTVRCLAVAGLTLVLAGPAWAQGKLTSEEIRDQVIGRTFDGAIADGAPVHTYFDPDGSVYTMFRENLRQGEWRISGDAYCARWDDLNPETWGCYNVVEQGGSVLLQRMNGTIQATGQLDDGDVYGLADAMAEQADGG